jgi:peptide/nickel transport system ATP-binding protein
MNPKWKMKQVLEESWDVPDDVLSEFGIQKTWLTRFTQELSGGELQRFSVVRSLNPKTKFLIADEMTTMLDAITQVQILTSVLDIVKKQNMGLLLVSHDMPLVDKICDEVIYFKDINGA